MKPIKNLFIFLLLGLAFALFQVPVQADNLAPPSVEVEYAIDFDATFTQAEAEASISLTGKEEVPTIRAGEFTSYLETASNPYLLVLTGSREYFIYNWSFDTWMPKLPTHYTKLGYGKWN